MADTREAGGAEAGLRTFDCPWCGAINRIPSDHLGEHFTCSECKKATKLTEHNTSTRKPTSPPQDAPQQPGARTFDCPWCGRISSIGTEYVGEHFDCPECKKSTKITDTNTRLAAVTTPPPEAPHAATASGGRRAAIAVLIVAVVGLAVWSALSAEKDKTTNESATAKTGGAPAVITGPAMGTETAPPAPPPESVGPAMGSETAPGTETSPPVEPTPTPPSATPEVTPEAAAAQAALTLATAEVAKATQRANAARAKLAAWEAQNPDAKDTVSNLATLHVLSKESDRLRATLDPAKVTPDTARGFNLAMVSFVGDDANRLRVAQRIFAQLRAYVHGRETIGQAWTDMNFYGPGVERCVKVWDMRWLMAPASPAALRKEDADAQAALAAAKQALDEAEKAVKALPAK